MTTQVDVQLAADDEFIPTAEDIANWVNRAIDAAGNASNIEVSVRVVGAGEMQQLNSEFRDQDKPTNVLSFPAGDLAGLPDAAERPIGDIVVCAAVVADEAERQGKTESDHWAHMIVHGTLHLLGFDHENDSDAAKMESLEIRIMTDHGVANPYADSLGESR
jgi:probable rRNA maturation factor